MAQSALLVVNALFTSLLASCQLFAIEPWSYLRDVFCLLAQWPEHALLELAPLNWNKTTARDEVRALLDAHPFHRLTLDVRLGSPRELVSEHACGSR